METAFYLKRPAAELTSIFVRISFEGKRLKYYIPEKINPKFWNKETQRAKETKNFREYPEFNTRLNNIESDIRNVFRKFQNDNNGMAPDEDTFKVLLDKEIRKTGIVKHRELSLFEYMEQFIARSKQGTRMNIKTKMPTVKSTNKGYGTLLNHLRKFQETYKPKIDFDTIDLDFYNEYLKYLTYTCKFRFNYIGDHIKRLKTILNEATERGINKNLAFKSKYFSKLREDSDAIYLSEKELKDLENLNLSKNSRLEKIRDLFLVSCLTGLRYSDYSILRADQIKDGFIEITQLKTGQPVTIPIHTTVQKILDKYNGSLPPSSSNQKTNDYLKEIGKMVPALHVNFSKTFFKAGKKITLNQQKWEVISTHTARRSFATNEYLAGTPTQTIMAITGHKSVSSFEKYIRLTNTDHAKLLKLHWDKRAEMKAV